MSPELVAELIRSRRTIHSFRPEPPPREAVVRAIDAARWTPNHRLTEPWRFYLLGENATESLCRLNAALVTSAKGTEAGQAKLRRWRAVPGWLVVTCARSGDPIREREDYAACCCALQNLMLYLWSAGIGSKWTTGAVTRETGFYEILSVDPGLEAIVALLWYGYPAEVPQTRRKPLAQILVDLP